MKIAITLYPLDDLGGIVSNIENQMWGLKELGHEVDFYLLGWQDKFMKGKSTDKELIKSGDGWYQGCLYAVNQVKGWNFPLERKIPYKGKDNLKKAKAILSKYDMIIWQIPVPTKQKSNKGNTDWIELYKANKVNILYGHDAHMVIRYPYVYEIKEYITGYANTHIAGYNEMRLGGVPKAMILSSHRMDTLVRRYNYYRRPKGFFSLQNFKPAKHVEDLLRAIPYIKYEKHLAGGGREQRYMVSKEKCKPEYFCRRYFDPELPIEVEKKKIKIWDYALQNGMTFHGWVTPRERNKLFQTYRVAVDPTWSTYLAKSGGIFNRVLTEACMNGAIPVCRTMGLNEGNVIFKPEENFLGVPHNATPQEFASVVNSANNLPRNVWKAMLTANYETIRHFDRKHCAQQFINLAKGKPAGFFQDVKILADTDPAIIAASAKMMRDFFGQEKPTIRREGIRKFF